MVIGKKPMLGNFYFGQIGLFHSVRQDSPTQRAEWGIFVGYQDYFTRHLIAYIPSRGSMYSKRKFVPMNSIPLEWHLQPRTPRNNMSTPTNIPTPIPNIIPSRNVIIQSGTPIIPSSVVPPSDGATLDSSPVVNEEGGNNSVTTVVPTINSPLLHQEGGIQLTASSTTSTAATTSTNDRAMVNSDTTTTSNNTSSATSSLSESATVSQQQSPASVIVTAPTPSNNNSSRPTRTATQKSWKDGPVQSRLALTSY
jgi:hypothetical protein